MTALLAPRPERSPRPQLRPVPRPGRRLATIPFVMVVALVLAGSRAIEAVRALNGATDGVKAAPGSLRGDFALSNRENIVHASDSPESAAREIALWFPGLTR